MEKFIGDAVMAVRGTPAAAEADAERAVRASRTAPMLLAGRDLARARPYGSSAAAAAIDQARDIAGQLRCQPLLNRIAALTSAAPCAGA